MPRWQRGRVEQHRATAPLSHRLRGLTLIEVLLSVVLLAGGAVLITQAVARSWETIRIAEGYTTAQLFAAAKLADLELAYRQGHDLTARPAGTFRAHRQAYAWRLDTVPEPDEAPALAVTLTVSWGRGRRVEEASYHAIFRSAPLPAAG